MVSFPCVSYLVFTPGHPSSSEVLHTCHDTRAVPLMGGHHANGDIVLKLFDYFTPQYWSQNFLAFHGNENAKKREI